MYLAEDLRHQRRVAIKVLKPELAAVLGAAGPDEPGEAPGGGGGGSDRAGGGRRAAQRTPLAGLDEPFPVGVDVAGAVTGPAPPGPGELR